MCLNVFEFLGTSVLQVLKPGFLKSTHGGADDYVLAAY